MGANILENASSEHSIDKFLQDYLPLEGESRGGEDIRWLVHKSTGKHFVFSKIQTNSYEQAMAYHGAIQTKMSSPSEFVTPLYRYGGQKIQQRCNTRFTIYLLFKLGNYTCLNTQIMRRTKEGKRFSEVELIEGIKSVTRGILWHRGRFTQYTISGNWSICPESVYYLNGRFCVADPWISQLTTSQTPKYSSRQRLLFLNQEIADFDRDSEQVFQIGMTFLQAAKLRSINNVYNKNKLNLNLLKEEIQSCGYPQLKEVLKQLLLGGMEKRREYLDVLEGRKVNMQKDKIIRFQKHKVLNKVHSSKKIKLVKYQKQNNMHFDQSTKENHPQSKGCTHLGKPVQENHKPTQITFSYRPYLNVQRLQLRPIQNQIDSVHRCIEKINRNLESIQSLVSQKIYNQPCKSSVVENVVESKIITTSNIQKQHKQSLNQSRQNQQHCKIEIPQTHTEESEVKNHKQVCQKDSLHVLMEQFQEEEYNRLTQSYNEATYTVNIHQGKTETSEAVSKAEKQESSLEIRDNPSDDTCGYVFKMQGTQLEGVSKLTIPEEEAEEEQSFEDGAQKTPKGEYVVHKNEKGGIYKGYMYNNKRNGLGTYIYLEGGYYEGNWKDNRMNGYGKIYYDSGQLAYEGMWYQDEIHGRGKLYNDSPTPSSEPFNYKNFDYEEYHPYEISYEGDFSHDLKEGFGKLTLTNGQFYSGEFHENNPHGKGYFSGMNSSVYGLWQNGIFIKAL